jgi:hypothetical protein
MLAGIYVHNGWKDAIDQCCTRLALPPRAEDLEGIPASVAYGIEQCELLIELGMIQYMTGKGAATSSPFRIVLRHELAHVSDYVRLRRILGPNFSTQQLLGTRRLTYQMAKSLWSEYYADRMAQDDPGNGELATKGNDLQRRLSVLTQILAVQGPKAVLFAWQNDASRIIGVFSYLSRCLGYVLGTKAALSTRWDAAPDLCRELIKLKWIEHIPRLEQELDELFRAEWEDADPLLPLENICASLVTAIGLHYDLSEDGELRFSC